MKSTRSAYDGSATSQPPVTLPLASSTPEASPTCNPTMFDNTDKHTFLPESEVGLSPCNWQDGRQMLLFGPEAALANRFRAPESEGGTPTSDTSGPLGSDLSASAALQSSLASRLHQRMDSNGSMEYSLTWKTRVTPAGRPICALRASGRRTLDKGCTGWLSPQAADSKRVDGGTVPTLPAAVQLMGWPTPKTPGGGRDNNPDPTHFHRLEDVVGLTGWPTPNAMEGGATSRSGERKDELLIGGLIRGWHTPKGTDGTKGGPNQTGETLVQDVMLTGWATPRAIYGEHSGMSDAKHLTGQAGASTSSSPAETTAPAASVLNPAMARWLMGFPASWDQSSPGWTEWESVQHALTESADSKATATPSCPKSQRSLSEQ